MVAFVGCGGSDTETSDKASKSATSSATEAVSEVTIEPVGNQMKYEQTEFTVEAGTEVTLTFDNTASSPAMKHNVVILNGEGDDLVQRVGTAASQASDSGYVPELDAIVAATDLADPGETVTMTFTVPSEPGTYTYICTFPGHYMMMQGTMRVVEA
ncbi:hypothetical protein CRI94_13320 [Longibacter salinarum]|uniref:Blue (type 1) copper domain-containing protein n=1 Tax=Longibacter salinarum TaxID=1850348 RepID=A0A2A8CVP7_9BACT|nr:plastocyanin/azurin family copper-binding protein [Longibacter salinarum]PEN12680.1 hypothetical protein CRI94_13320 [Longibacter salinarum]